MSPTQKLHCLRLLSILVLLEALPVAGTPVAEETVPTPLPGVIEATTIPPRPPGAVSGSEFGRRTKGLPGIERQRAARLELLSGNVPGFLRHLQPVRLSRQLATGASAEAVVWVMPDYLAIGSDEDYLRMPLTYPTATGVLRELGFVLPTPRIVDAVYEQAQHHLKPEPMPPGPRMRSIEYYLKHRQLIERQLRGIPQGELIAGHKKDVVLTRRLTQKPNRIAIYGWHRLSGAVIQPLSTVHVARYADYSHGVRPVWAQVWLAGEERSFYDLLADPVLAPLLSDEGALPSARQLMQPEDTRSRSARRPPG